MLQVAGLNGFYGKVQAIWDISLEVRQGEILTIVGTNGAGKTTLLKAVVGLIDKTGSVVFDGQDISGMPGHKMAELGIAYVPEGRQVFPEMTVLENLVVGSYNKRAKPSRQASLDDVLTTFPSLKQRLANLAGSLSGGEQQMVAIGRGLMSKPRLMLLDEPSLGISPILTDEIFKRIEDMKKSITIVLVEQHVQHALSICDRGYVVEHGRVVLTGSGEALRNDPRVQEAYLGL